jgi:aspartyl-tRNA(Asn)/glutamyl-tRNA(Gln) amidotransferase subunit C
MSERLTKDELKHIASLAKLNFSDIEIDRFDKEFNDILGYVSLVKECDTSGIEYEHNLEDYSDSILQADEPVIGLSTEEALLNATEGRSKGGFIVTSKIVTKE